MGQAALKTRPVPIMELLFLHALPLDGSMWAAQMDFLPGRNHAPTLYGFGNRIEEWAAAALQLTESNRLIVVGCSVGGSCALEVATLAPERVAALVLIGTKAAHRPDPALHGEAIGVLKTQGIDAAWDKYWRPLIANPNNHDDIKRIARRQPLADIKRGVDAFHSRPSREHMLTEFEGPVVIVSGDHDPTPGVTTSAAQAAQTVQGQLHVVPNCGHYVPLEQPEKLNNILQAVIKAVEANI